MTDIQVTVLAQFKAKEGMEDRVKQELLALVTPTLTEPGCLNYNLHQSPDDKRLFMFYENWREKADLDRHFEMPHLVELEGKLGEMLAEPVSITLWQMIA